MSKNTNLFLQQIGIKYPIICGPMYPCSNPELVAAVSNAGGIGIIQPIALTYVHGYDLAEGIDYIKSLTNKPIGMNLLIEKNSKKYHQKMVDWMDIAIEKGVKLFITSLGKPDWVVKKAHAAGAYVYHDATESKWAQKAVEAGVDGLIAVNDRAGGHAGSTNYDNLFEELKKFGLPVICAGGISDREGYKQALKQGYQAVQMGTRFIATEECTASDAYKQAIVNAKENDIVLTERITGIPVSVINTPYIQKQGLKPNILERWMLNNPKMKYFMRTILLLKSLKALKKSHFSPKDFWQAGKSVESINEVLSVKDIMVGEEGLEPPTKTL
jgi:nitronate monooxygenase